MRKVAIVTIALTRPVLKARITPFANGTGD
jgi:hypothetical protein